MDLQEFISLLSRLRQPAPTQEVLTRREKEALSSLYELLEVDRQSLATLFSDYPEVLPLLGTCVGLGREGLKNELSYRMGSAGHVGLSRGRASETIEWLDEDFSLVEAVKAQMYETWDFEGIIAERRLWSSRRAQSSITAGRSVEDRVEEVIAAFEVPYVMRTSFPGSDGRSVPADFAIPTGGEGASILGAAKGFDSTGSKLTDAVREINELCDNRLQGQFIFAIVDGIGWLNRRRDLERIYALYERGALDGLYCLAMFEAFQGELRHALRARGFLDP